MKYIFYIVILWFEIRFTKIQRFFGKRKDTSVIPEGHYCYIWDKEKNLKEPFDGYWTIPCKYYRGMKDYAAGCTYIGYMGWDPCLGDQCKICSENYGDIEE